MPSKYLTRAPAQLTMMSSWFYPGAEGMYVRQWLCGSVLHFGLEEGSGMTVCATAKCTSSARCKSHFDIVGGCIKPTIVFAGRD